MTWAIRRGTRLLRPSYGCIRHSSSIPVVQTLTPLASPLLMRMHPDRVQHHSIEMAETNELAIKELNAFLAMARDGCAHRAIPLQNRVREELEARRKPYPKNSGATPLSFDLDFHVEPTSDALHYTIQVPETLVRRALFNDEMTDNTNLDHGILNVSSPLARAWQHFTQRTLKELFAVANVEVEGTRLEEWMLSFSDPGDTKSSRTSKGHNKRRMQQHKDFDDTYHKMLMREKNVVYKFTTGLEDGPTTQHQVLTDLLSQRLVLPKLETIEERRAVYRWIADLLLLHFMDLKLHSLVWNKVTLLVTTQSLEKLEVEWDRRHPEQGMGILISTEMDPTTVISELSLHVERLDEALRGSSKRSTSSPKQHGRKKSHFYQQELDKLFQ